MNIIQNLRQLTRSFTCKNAFAYSLLFWGSISIAQGQAIKKVYFIGNSYTAYNDLAGITQYIGASHGDTFEVNTRAPGGMTFNLHSIAPDLYTELRNGQYDAVILQEQSQIPSLPLSQVESMCFPYAKLLVDSIRTINPKCKIVFYTTWGRENGDQQNCPNWEPVCTFQGMNELLRQRYQQMAKDNKSKAAPIASVWRDLRDTTNLQLYSGDGSHPSIQGSIVAAATIYATLFSKQLNSNIQLQAINAQQKYQIFNTVNKVISDSLSFYDFETKTPNSMKQFDTYNRPNALCLSPENPKVYLSETSISMILDQPLYLHSVHGSMVCKIYKAHGESYIELPINDLNAGSYILTNRSNFQQPILILK
jgi:hypothetical protein